MHLQPTLSRALLIPAACKPFGPTLHPGKRRARAFTSTNRSVGVRQEVLQPHARGSDHDLVVLGAQASRLRDPFGFPIQGRDLGNGQIFVPPDDNLGPDITGCETNADNVRKVPVRTLPPSDVSLVVTVGTAPLDFATVKTLDGPDESGAGLVAVLTAAGYDRGKRDTAVVLSRCHGFDDSSEMLPEPNRRPRKSGGLVRIRHVQEMAHVRDPNVTHKQTLRYGLGAGFGW